MFHVVTYCYLSLRISASYRYLLLSFVTHLSYVHVVTIGNDNLLYVLLPIVIFCHGRQVN